MTGRLLQRLAAVWLAAALGLAAVPSVPAAPGRPGQPAPVVVQTTRGGFDWGDAAIGAAAALGLVLAIAGTYFRTGDRHAP